METLGLYIQVPFCASKCSFCNFSSGVERGEVFDGYCHALAEEIRRLPDLYHSVGVTTGLFSSPVDTIYIGGGTPSLMGSRRLEKIVAGLHRQFRFTPEIEFTIEVTPGTANEDFLKNALAFGINRLSFGAQSFDDHELRSVGRLHSAQDTRAAFQTARRVGFGNINLDLIAGLPHQTEASWQSSLQSAISLQPEHISVYLFEIDERSRLGSESLRHGVRYHADAIPDDDFMADAYERARDLLPAAGYIQYEISNFALAACDSTHNRKYWQLKPYVGLGAGAHSFDGQFRWENSVAVEEYQRLLKQGESPISELHRLTPDAQMEEFFFLGLRQMEGIDVAYASRRWGPERLKQWAQKIESLERDSLLIRQNGHLRLAEKAVLISNEVFQEFIGL
ncbi:MAG TPA: radical SAM family heme chaperone HemW [Terriglobia bacterium]|nr:radical SAM family heme chaperone HemW [Terriglobia bacterium]